MSAKNQLSVSDLWGYDVGSSYTRVPRGASGRLRALGATWSHVCILMELIGYRHDSSLVVWPSQKNIAQALGMEAGNLRRELADLERKGFISSARHGDGRGKSYTLLFIEKMKDPPVRATPMRAAPKKPRPTGVIKALINEIEMPSEGADNTTEEVCAQSTDSERLAATPEFQLIRSPQDRADYLQMATDVGFDRTYPAAALFAYNQRGR